MTINNLFSEIPATLPDELFNTILDNGSVRIERIVSHGHASAPEFWFDQDRHEWVILLKGQARLAFEGDDIRKEMIPGDFINIPAHKRHRVEWTSPDEPTMWLAIYYS